LNGCVTCRAPTGDQIEHRQPTALHDIGRTHIYGLIARGELRSVKVGRNRRIPAAALQEYVHNLMRTGGGDAAA
jgi:excisionase family DNA binding protein